MRNIFLGLIPSHITSESSAVVSQAKFHLPWHGLLGTPVAEVIHALKPQRGGLGKSSAMLHNLADLSRAIGCPHIFSNGSHTKDTLEPLSYFSTKISLKISPLQAILFKAIFKELMYKCDHGVDINIIFAFTFMLPDHL